MHKNIRGLADMAAAGAALSSPVRRRVSAVVVLGLVPAAALAGAGRAVAAPGGGAAVAAGVISTAAGGVGGPALATRVSLREACGVAYAAGHMYVADGGTVRAVSKRTGWLTTPAGTGAASPPGAGGPAAIASLSGVCGVVVDHSGNLVISDAGHSRVRVVAHKTGRFYGRPMTGGHIYTVAGNGIAGFSGDRGPAAKARLNQPRSVAVDGAGNLLIADLGNDRVRVVAHKTGRFYGQPMTAGHIYTVAGNGIAGFSGDGGPATRARLNQPRSVAVDGAGNLLIADTGNYRVRVVAGRAGTFYGRPMTAGHTYTVAGNGRAGFSGDGGPATKAELGGPSGVSLGGTVATDGRGNLLIGDATNARIRVVAHRSGRFYGRPMTAGDIYTIAGHGNPAGDFSGDGGPATRAHLGFQQSVATDSVGNLLIADSDNHRIRVVAHRSGRFYGRPMTAGDIYTIAGNGTFGYSGDGGPAIRAQLGPDAVATDGAGNLLIADTASNRIRVLAHRSGRFYGRPMTAAHIYTVAGDGRIGSAGDGGPATKAELGFPQGVAADAAGNLLIADTGLGFGIDGGNRIRVVAASTGSFYGQPMTAGDIYTIAGDGIPGSSGDGGPATAAELSPSSVTTDAAGNLLIADTSNDRVRVVAASTGSFYGQPMTAGDIYTIAGNGTTGFSGDGGPATAAELYNPSSVTADAAGNLLFADTGNNRVRVIAASTGSFYGQPMTAGDIYTIAGDGTSGYSGDRGPATKAALRNPSTVTADAAGNLLIADTGNNRIRVVAHRAGRFYGQPMTAGDIYTIAGNGASGFSGDHGPATRAELSFPHGVATDAAGNLLIADTGNNRVREVAS